MRTNSIIFSFAVLLAIVFAAQDYYKTLGIPRSADQS